MDERSRIQTLITILDDTYGQLCWWDAPFDEIVIGAVLTQQTRWENVQSALELLRAEGICTLHSILLADPTAIESCIRSTGFFRVKTARLISLAEFIVKTYGTPEQLALISTEELRRSLLTVNGVGEETADSILCYGLFREVFVIDAYTRRICRCAGITGSRSEITSLFLEELQHDNALLRSCHGQMVEYAKEYCTKKRCPGCRIQTLNG
ncbi:MAG: Fe-S cluster assembly protein HesB [Methanocalculus sp.]|uniref:endonuclease III domain-containing protein n=1 Tax=Methanocalculus sp. TaxID=2004547 RepID=UPI00271E9EEA|nr:Fe-S cluster assembly protein HesB [Methanocalculus sp.]MDO9538780.1 Fe-S cluster assembly protein HesB [Methanocalculus sp.]